MMNMTAATKLASKKSLSFTAVGLLWLLFLSTSLLLFSVAAAATAAAPKQQQQQVEGGMVTGEIVSCSG
jgi:hypothetical protein